METGMFICCIRETCKKDQKLFDSGLQNRYFLSWHRQTFEHIISPAPISGGFISILVFYRDPLSLYQYRVKFIDFEPLSISLERSQEGFELALNQSKNIITWRRICDSDIIETSSF
jgi:hypothetical protein